MKVLKGCLLTVIILILIVFLLYLSAPIWLAFFGISL